MPGQPQSAKPESPSPIEGGLDVLLTLLYAPGASGTIGEPVLGITRLQKLLFLLWKEGSFFQHVPDLYNFKAYDFGPCMDDLYDDLEFAEDVGLISVTESPSGNEYEGADEEAFLKDFGFQLVRKETRRDYSLTDDGIEAGKELFDVLDHADQDRITQIKRRFNSMPFFDLLRYVYRKYPTFAKRSVLSL
jgi:hypothetical protein